MRFTTGIMVSVIIIEFLATLFVTLYSGDTIYIKIMIWTIIAQSLCVAIWLMIKWIYEEYEDIE